MGMEERVRKACGRYLEHVGYHEIADDIGGFILAESEEGTYVFVKPMLIETFGEDELDIKQLRREFEQAIIQAAFAGDDEIDMHERALRCDVAQVVVIREDRAVLKHIINAINKDMED